MKEMNVWKHYFGTTLHKFWVSWYIFKFSMSLLKRSLLHDLSKYLPSEASGFIKVIDKLEFYTYGSEAYKESLRTIKPSIDKHYKRNRHHPEHSILGIYGMNLVDIVEMWCDWQASVKRSKDGNIEKSIKNNKDRFAMDDQLTNLLYNQWMDN